MRRFLGCTILFLINYVAHTQSNANQCQAEAVFKAYNQECPTFSKDSYCIELSADEIKVDDEKKITYLWEMGDGTQQKGANCFHCYNKPGDYLSTLYVTTEVEHGIFTDTIKNDIAIENIVSIEYNYESNSKTPQVFFDASKSFVSNDFTTSGFLWNFGDGSYQCGEIIFHRYEKKGNYQVRLIIKGMLNGKEEWICGSKEIKID